MGAQRAAEEPDQTSFTATVKAVDGNAVILDRTYFYAESGGQPADRGTIDGIPVSAVVNEPEHVVHVLERNPSFAAGDAVHGEVDDAFRTYCRRAHTASHVFYGVARQLLENLGYGGFDIGERKVRIDFETTSPVDDALLVELEREANRVVWESRSVTWNNIPLDEVNSLPGVAFNSKTEEGVFEDGDDVRIVEIGPAPSEDDSNWLDRAACGGTHVTNTNHIGPIAVIDRSNPGEGMTRIELAVGPEAIEHRANVTKTAYDVQAILNVGLSDVPSRVMELRDERDELMAELQAATDRVVASQIEAIDPIQRDGESWIVGVIDGAETDVLASNARKTLDSDIDVVALVNRHRPTSITVASSEVVDASEVVDRITEHFGGGGGGGPDFAQGGGIDADPDAVVDHLEG